MVVAFGPTASGGNTVSAEGVELLKKLPPNSTAPRSVPGLNVLMSSCRRFTSNVRESVADIEHESSMIASMLVALAHALVCALGPLAPLGAAMAPIVIPASAMADTTFLPRVIWTLPPGCGHGRSQAIAWDPLVKRSGRESGDAVFARCEKVLLSRLAGRERVSGDARGKAEAQAAALVA